MPESRPDITYSHRWRPIDDLPEDWSHLCSRELRELHRRWVAEKNLIKDTAKISELQERMFTQWAIETGLIERLYSVDRGVTVALVEGGLAGIDQFHKKGQVTASARALIEDQRRALDFVMDLVAGKRALTPSYMKELHGGLTKNQPFREVLDPRSGEIVKQDFIRGDWKQWPNSPQKGENEIHEYAPPEQVPSEIDNLLAWHREHQSVCPEVEAAWLHHRFTQIHPFDDGNGRMARALATSVFLQRDYLPLVVRDEEHREEYVAALEEADRGDLSALAGLFASIQMGDLKEALNVIRALRGEATISAAEAAAASAKQRQERSLSTIEDTLDELTTIATIRLEEVAAEIRHAFESSDVVVATFVSADTGKEDWWYQQIVACGKLHDYFIDFDRRRRWASLGLDLPSQEGTGSRLVVSVHGIERLQSHYAISAFLTEQDSELGRVDTVIPAEPFLFRAEATTEEALEDTKARFRVWLDDTLPLGIQEWSKHL